MGRWNKADILVLKCVTNIYGNMIFWGSNFSPNHWISLFFPVQTFTGKMSFIECYELARFFILQTCKAKLTNSCSCRLQHIRTAMLSWNSLNPSNQFILHTMAKIFQEVFICLNNVWWEIRRCPSIYILNSHSERYKSISAEHLDRNRIPFTVHKQHAVRVWPQMRLRAVGAEAGADGS